jgi:hypothetical protein
MIALTLKVETQVLCAARPHTMVVTSAKLFSNPTMDDKDMDETRTIRTKAYTEKLT